MKEATMMDHELGLSDSASFFRGVVDVDKQRTLQTTTTTANDATILLDSVRLYGVILLVTLVVFSFLRRSFPKVYNVRGWVDSLKTYLAEDQYGFVSWMWRVYMITDDEIMEECGMDAVCYIRLVQMGYRLR